MMRSSSFFKVFMLILLLFSSSITIKAAETQQQTQPSDPVETAQQTTQPNAVDKNSIKGNQEVSASVTSVATDVMENFDVDKATQAYIDRLDKDQLQQSNAYFEGGYWLQLWNFLFGILVAYLLLQTGLSQKMKHLSEKITRFQFIQNIFYLVQYILIVSIVSFPLTWYQGFYREHQYDLSNLVLGDWMGEQLKGLMLSLIFVSIFVSIIYVVVRKAAKTWAVWGSVISIIFIAFMAMIGPVYISPLFNDYKALDDGPVKTEILKMARENSVPADNVYQFDASKQSKRISANVSGMFGTLRVSLNDNLLNRSDPATIKGVMGHELGHYVLNHGMKFLISFSIVMVLAFAFLKWGFRRFNRESWGIQNEGDIAGFPLAMAVLSVYFFLMTPVTNTIIRTSETEADMFGLNTSREPEGFAEGIFSLSEYRKMKPGYWEEVIFYDHPSGYNRIHAAMQWKKENPGVGKHFSNHK